MHIAGVCNAAEYVPTARTRYYKHTATLCMSGRVSWLNIRIMIAEGTKISSTFLHNWWMWTTAFSLSNSRQSHHDWLWPYNDSSWGGLPLSPSSGGRWWTLLTWFWWLVGQFVLLAEECHSTDGRLSAAFLRDLKQFYKNFHF